jgi:uncharacterized protein
MSYERDLVATLTRALNKPLPVFHVLTGPRQVGKTTIARQVMTRLPFASVYSSADSPLPLGPEWIATQFRLAEVEAGQSGEPLLLVLDEVQKIHGWSEALKSHWDGLRHSGKDIRLLVLGSSALLIHDGLTESLAGRFFLHRCGHWTYSECAAAFGWDLARWMYFGGYPGAAVFTQDVREWKRYILDSLIETVIARDVLQLQKISKPALLRHLFTLAATYPAQILSYNKMLGQLQEAGNTTTLAHYLKLLESAFLASGLEMFSLGQLRRRGSSPKLVLWNNGLISALSPPGFKEAVADGSWWGRLVENGVGAHLLNTLPGTEYSISYWRHRGNEVDYVVSKGRTIWALEVKSGRTSKAPGVGQFLKQHPQARPLLIGGPGIPLETFLGRPAEEWFAEG